MNRNAISIWVAVCVPIFMGVLSTVAYGLDLKSKIDPLAGPLVENDLAVGFVVGIVKDGETQVLAYGETIQGSGIAPDGNSIYEIGSISKVFTGVLVADMARNGIVKLKDPVQKYLPAEVRMPVADGKPITLEHLATHTSGLPRLPDNFKPADGANPYADYKEPQLFEFLTAHKLRRPPGQYEYSNYGMGLLGHILARRMGKTYEQYLVSQICGPLEMRDTCITLNSDQRKRLAPPYTSVSKRGKNWDFSTLAGTGGIRSTCNDMIKFIKANLPGPTLQHDDKPLMRSLRLAHEQHHMMKDGQGIGLGWHIAADGVTRWKNGMTGGYQSCLYIVPSRNFGVIVLSNTTNSHITQLGNSITLVAAFGRHVELPKLSKAVQVDSAVLKSYVGVYRLAPQCDITVTFEDDKLMARVTGQDKFQVFAESKTKFFYKVVDAKISFVADRHGNIDHLILHQNGDHKAVRQ